MSDLAKAIKEVIAAWDAYMNADGGDAEEFNVLGFAMERLRQAAKVGSSH